MVAHTLAAERQVLPETGEGQVLFGWCSGGLYQGIPISLKTPSGDKRCSSDGAGVGSFAYFLLQ